LGEVKNCIKRHMSEIVTYGNKILRETCSDFTKEEKGFKELVGDLWNTLNLANGVGLAAPQINRAKRVFIVDSKVLYDELNQKQRDNLFSGDKGIQETFINAWIFAKSEEKWNEPEGCLSIPGINEPVERSWDIILEYRDMDFNFQRKQFSGYTAKVIQHELDHTNGILFIDHLPALSKRLLKNKLKKIRVGKIEIKQPSHTKL
jgi:peptide deformylase